MTTFLAVIAAAVLIGLYRLYKRSKRRKQARHRLAKEWGKAKKRDHNWAQIRYYFDLFKGREDRVTIDDDTWNDLNFDAIFRRIDRTESTIGQQVLYDLLRHPAQKEKILQKRGYWIQLFAKQPHFRLDLQMQLQKLTGFGMWRLTNLFFEELPKIPRSFYSLLAIPVIVVLFFALGFIYPIFFLGFAVMPIINLTIRYFAERRVARYTSALSSLPPFLSVVGKICESHSSHDNLLDQFGEKLKAQYQKVHKLKNRVSKYLEESNPNDASMIFTEYLNLLFLVKINMFTLSVRSIGQNQDTLQSLYHKLGYIDAMISVASFKTHLHCQCQPVFNDAGNELKYENMVHPLLDEPVANSVLVGEKGILVTGSNMSGKTTFLKTIGVNQILAQTFNFCCAEKAEITFCAIVSSMRREDDLTAGKSFYLGEVERIKKLLDLASESDGKILFLLDEIFRGTNTIERISASLEVLRWLNRPSNFVLASTHDLELVELLDQEYAFFHFAETIKNQNMTFDYQLKPGQSSTKNAIKLLGISGYPAEIVNRAMEISEKLERQGVVNFWKKI